MTNLSLRRDENGHMYPLFQSFKLQRYGHHIKVDHPVLAYHIIWFHIPGSLVLRTECRVIGLF